MASKAQTIKSIKRIQAGTFLSYMTEEERSNEKIVLEAVQRNGYALKYAHKDLQDNFNIVLAAVKYNPIALQFASERLQKDSKILEHAQVRNKNIVKIPKKGWFKHLKKEEISA